MGGVRATRMKGKDSKDSKDNRDWDGWDVWEGVSPEHRLRSIRCGGERLTTCGGCGTVQWVVCGGGGSCNGMTVVFNPISSCNDIAPDVSLLALIFS